MAEYIERKTALRFVFDACTECMDACEEFDGIYADCNQCMLEGVKLKLRDLPAADVRPVEWIPVTERLPENGYYVLAYEDGDIMMASYAGGNWILRDMFEVIDDIKPTHWMPLPEPPKEET